MTRLRNTVLAAAATAALAWVPSAPALAAGPLLFAPWAFTHIVAPLIVGAALSAQPRAPYPGAGYYGPPNGYAPAPYYAQPSGYYAPPVNFARGYYGASPYAPAPPRPYPYNRGVYPQPLPYHSSYGGHQVYRPPGLGYRR